MLHIHSLPPRTKRAVFILHFSWLAERPSSRRTRETPWQRPCMRLPSPGSSRTPTRTYRGVRHRRRRRQRRRMGSPGRRWELSPPGRSSTPTKCERYRVVRTHHEYIERYSAAVVGLILSFSVESFVFHPLPRTKNYLLRKDICFSKVSKLSLPLLRLQQTTCRVGF